jgi:FkbM family methyltransferase
MFDLNNYINSCKREYIDIGFCKFPWENSRDHNWMFGVTFLDIWGKKLFGIENSNEGSYEEGQVIVPSSGVVIDVGANLGLFSAYACSLGCKVYAVEPLERNLRFLKLLKELNPIFDLTICNCVLSNYNGMATLYNEGNDMGGGTILEDIKQNNVNRSAKNKNIRPIIKTLTNSLTLDAFVEMNKIESIDFIKADIEGAEISLLEGGKESIAKLKPKLSLCSYHRTTDQETLNNLILNIREDYNIIKGEKKIYAY